MDDSIKAPVVVSPAKRGRPPSGDKTMTNAERQALSRKRLAATGRGTITLVLSDELLAALDKFVEFKDMSKSEAISKILTTQLFRKR